MSLCLEARSISSPASSIAPSVHPASARCHSPTPALPPLESLLVLCAITFCFSFPSTIPPFYTFHLSGIGESLRIVFSSHWTACSASLILLFATLDWIFEVLSYPSYGLVRDGLLLPATLISTHSSSVNEDA
jgi:hypothetical protein